MFTLMLKMDMNEAEGDFRFPDVIAKCSYIYSSNRRGATRVVSCSGNNERLFGPPLPSVSVRIPCRPIQALDEVQQRRRGHDLVFLSNHRRGSRRKRMNETADTKTGRTQSICGDPCLTNSYTTTPTPTPNAISKRFFTSNSSVRISRKLKTQLRRRLHWRSEQIQVVVPKEFCRIINIPGGQFFEKHLGCSGRQQFEVNDRFVVRKVHERM